MAVIDERTGLEALDRNECLTLLGRSSLGRIAVVDDDCRPLIFPVNFALDGSAIVLRSDPGTKLHRARKGWVAFECDGVDSVYHTGWSVLASGIAEVVHNDAELADLARLPLAMWAPGPKSTWIRIRPRVLTGRRIPPHGHPRPDGARACFPNDGVARASLAERS
jgi:nitroimidazol reductase NimA-like FMN-containing flavoprotein (pyridoxamine 5'-phosphate oxidase superfamily)